MENVTNNPLVSIIVRTKDRPKLLNRALQSIAAQTYRPIEVVLVNDGGCDLEMEEVKKILGNVGLNYQRLEKNTGRAHAGNVGIENAKGEYIGLLDDDDELYPEHLEVLTEILLNNAIYIAYADAENVIIERDVPGRLVEKERSVIYSQDFTRELLLIQNYIPFMCILFRRGVFDSTRIDETFELFEDWELLIRLSRLYWFEHAKKVTARYVQWSDTDQINRQAQTGALNKEAYLRILRRNIGQITPEVIHAFCEVKSGEQACLRDELHRAFVERQKIISERQGIEADKKRLFNEYVGLQAYVSDIHNSISWKLITRYRSLKQRLIPVGSKRRALYDLLLKSVRVIGQEGLKGFFIRLRRKLRFNVHYMRFKFKLKRYRSLNFEATCKGTGYFGFLKSPVHIIMPVFNGYECIGDCLNSLFRNTDLSFHTLVIIDDKSTDKRVPEYLRKVQENKGHRKIEIAFNDRNLGFVKTINEGMRRSPGDVIILNSDTILTANWVEKLQRAAYSKLGVATASPLSNYVTINGIPEPFKFNPVPSGMDIDGFSSFIEKISLRYYPEVPAGVGFCMFIKKVALEEMGYFDEAKFERGYAEETDFCMRALKKGYIHVLDDATYIYHIGGVSFESIKDPEVIREKNLMIERNLEILRTLHPEYLGLVEEALRKNLATIHSYIDMRLDLEKNKLEDTVCNRSKA